MPALNPQAPVSAIPVHYMKYISVGLYERLVLSFYKVWINRWVHLLVLSLASDFTIYLITKYFLVIIAHRNGCLCHRLSVTPYSVHPLGLLEFSLKVTRGCTPSNVSISNLSFLIRYFLYLSSHLKLFDGN